MHFNLISAINPNTATHIFIIITLIVMAIGIISRFKHSNRFVESLPGVAVSLGILGTFVGIFLGLYTFDVHNIDKSVPDLLEGLKTAFITSIVGMMASLTMKIIYDLIGGKEDKNIKYDDPVPVLTDLLEITTKINENSRDSTNVILKCFKSDEEYSLISQVKLIRQEMIDSRKEIRASLTFFAEKLTEASTKTLVDALNKVITDFNTLLGELVGETFKELSSAMINLNKWQDNYKVYIETTEARLAKISKDSESIFEKANSLIEKVDNAEQSLHMISKSLEKITLNSKMLEHTTFELINHNEIFKTSLEQIKQLGIDSQNVIPNLVTSLETIGSSLSAAVNDVSENLNTSSQKFIEMNTNNLNNFIERIKNISEALQESTKELEKHLETQLNQSLDSLASALGTLSSKFISDYTPLTEKLRKIIEISEKSYEN